MTKRDELKRLGIAAYEGREIEPSAKQALTKNFSEEKVNGIKDCNDLVRQFLINKMGGSEVTEARYERAKPEFFEILSVLVTEKSNHLTKEIFEQIMDFKDFPRGCKPEFKIENDDVFDVSIVANSTTNLIRQRMWDNKVPTTPFDMGVKIYEEFNSFVSGKIDFKKMIDRLVVSYNHKIAELIANLFGQAYDSINAQDLKVTGTGVEMDKLLDLVTKVGDGAVIYGTKMALSKIPHIEGFATDSTDIRNNGFVRMTNGVQCVELKNHYNRATGEYAMPNDVLYVIPAGQKLLVGGFEGDAVIRDSSQNSDRYDMQLEYTYIRRIHLGMAIASRFGAYKIA